LAPFLEAVASQLAPDPKKDDDCWTVSTLNSGETVKGITRVRTEAPKGIERADFSTSVIIEWRYQGDGLPDKETDAQQVLLEDLLDPLTDNQDNSFLMHVVLQPGSKEWGFYTKDYDRYMAELNGLLKGHPKFPITIMHDRDPSWSYWTTIKSTYCKTS
jgi:hypothetical protein